LRIFIDHSPDNEYCMGVGHMSIYGIHKCLVSKSFASYKNISSKNFYQMITDFILLFSLFIL